MTNLRKYEILVSTETLMNDIIWREMWRTLAPLRMPPSMPEPGDGYVLCGAFTREIAETHAAVLAHALLSQKYQVMVRVRPQPEISDLSTFG